MTDEEESALLIEGQAIADQQMLETLLTLDPVAREYFDGLAELYPELPLVDFVQYWLEIYD